MSPTRSAASTRARCCSATARSRPCTCSPPFSVRRRRDGGGRAPAAGGADLPRRVGTRRRETLAEAAARAGWPPPLLVPEPVGAARYFADVLRRPVPFGSSLAVFDFGGGTLDVAVVRNDGAHFAVIGSGGIEDLGGLDIDAALVDHLGRTIAQSRPDVWQASEAGTTAQRTGTAASSGTTCAARRRCCPGWRSPR